MIRIVLLFLFFTCSYLVNGQTTYTWTGSSSTDWNTAGNWSPSAVPSSSDHIILNNGSLTNMPLLDANHSITNITVSAGTLNLNTHTLTITGTTSLTGGTINNGQATFNNSTTTIAGTTFGAVVSITASKVTLSSSTFNSKIVVTKTGSSTDGTGGNTYNDTLDIHLSNGNIAFASTGNESYNGDVFVSNTTSGYITLGSAGSYGGTLATGKKLYVGSGGFASGQLYLRKLTQTGTTAQSLTLTGSSTQLIISNSTTFNAVTTLQAPSINIAGSTFNKKVILIKTGSGTDTQGGNTFNDTLDIRLQNGSIGMAGTGNDTYNSDVYVSNTGSGYIALGTVGSFGCTLATGKKLYIGTAGFSSGSLYLRKFTQTGTTAQSLTLGGTTTLLTIDNASTFNGVLTVQSPSVSFVSSTFNKKVIITKTGSSTDGFGGNTYNDTLDIRVQGGNMAMANTANDAYNGDVYVSNTGSGYLALGAFSTYGGTLASGKKLYIGSGGFSSGQLYLRKFTQSGSTVQSLTFGGSSTQFIINNASTFNGNLTVSSPNVIIEGSTFNGTLTITKSSSSTNTWTVANTYNGDVSLTNTGTGYINPSYTASGGDTYNANATFTKSSSGDILIAGNASTVTFKGNVTLANISSTQFTGSQLALFSGTVSQTLSQSGGVLSFAKVTINKASNHLTLSSPLAITSSLTLTSGNIISSSTNKLSLVDNATVSSASNTSYIDGPVAKTGDDTFTFPVGKSGIYRPISIAAPASSVTVFTAEFINANQTLGSTLQSPITRISNCEYWTLTRSGSSSNVAVTLNWGTGSCETSNPSLMRVGSWDGSQWADLGNASNTGSNTAGSVTSTTVSSFTAFVLGNTCSNSASITSAPTSTSNVCPGVTVTLTCSSASAYLWSTTATTQAISPTTNGTYTVTAFDANNCGITASRVVAFSTITASITPSPNPPTNICDDVTITLTANTASTYSWSPTSETTQAINPATDGNYVLTTYDAGGCSATANIDVSFIHPPETPEVPGDGPVTRCLGNGEDEYSTEYDANVNSYEWELTPVEAGTVSSSGNEATIVWDNEFSGIATLTVKATNTCGFTENELEITVSPLQTYYADLDGDGYPNPFISVNTCPVPDGYIPLTEGFDCNDNEFDE